MEMAGKSIPRVSVIIPLYNHEKFISETVDSVLRQTYQDFELIIINDGSTDGSEEIVKSITDARIRYYCQKNQGAFNTINRGIQLARGEYISILNSDDVYYPQRIDECVGILENDSSIAAVFSYVEYVDEAGNFIKLVRGNEHNWSERDPDTTFKGEDNALLDLLAGNFLITTSNLFCRGDIFKKVGYFSTLKYAHDYDFFLRLFYHYKCSIINTPLVKYRIHGHNTLEQNNPEVNFEVGLVLANFLLHYDVQKFFADQDQKDRTMMKFFNSINTYDTERMIMVLLFFGMKMGSPDTTFYVLSQDPQNPFRKTCIESFGKYIESWKHGLEGWEKWNETNRSLIQKDKELQEAWRHMTKGWEKWNETNQRLIQKEKELQEGWEKWNETNQSLFQANEEISSLTHSRSFRLGRALTWPLRKVRDMVNHARK